MNRPNTIMRRAACFLFIVGLTFGCAQAQAPPELVGATDQQWQSSALITYTSQDASAQDTAYVASDTDWVAFMHEPKRTWISCQTIDAPVPLDTLSHVAEATVRGRLAPGMNGPLSSIAQCAEMLRSILDQDAVTR
jgi:hypothetical protein